MNKSFRGKKVLVYGMGASGQAACKLLHSEGACVSIYDDEMRYSGIFNFVKQPTQFKYDLVVVSPGIKVMGNEIISHFLMTKTPVLSELDLGYLFCKGRMIGVTGTNGKTTTVMLLGDILKAAGLKHYVCGNIGLPLCSIAKDTDRKSITVCEVSNFQLELSNLYHADMACVLNLAPDHLDRHGSFEEYIRVKTKLINKKQTLFLNLDDERVSTLRPSKKNIFFSLRQLNRGIYLKNSAIYYNKTKIIPLSEIPLVGDKNLLNVMAAVGIACRLRVKPKIIRMAIANFTPAGHRLQYLGKTKLGADVVDDSKATNISSTLMALESLQGRKITLLLGGQNKGCEFDEIFNKNIALDGLICFGQAGQEIAACATKYGYNPEVFDTLEGASIHIRETAAEGQMILLSPACASFDEFSSYAVRGERFKEYIFEEHQ